MDSQAFAYKLHESIKRHVADIDQVLRQRPLETHERQNLAAVLNRLNLAACDLRLAFDGIENSYINQSNGVSVSYRIPRARKA